MRFFPHLQTPPYMVVGIPELISGTSNTSLVLHNIKSIVYTGYMVSPPVPGGFTALCKILIPLSEISF